MQASKEVWGKIFGKIDTRQKFLNTRLELAEHEWARLKANNSLECRNCHSAAAMNLSKQTTRAADIHSRFLLSGERTCLDCHKGIAHDLPDMRGIAPGWQQPPELRGKESSLHDERMSLAHYLASVSPAKPSPGRP